MGMCIKKWLSPVPKQDSSERDEDTTPPTKFLIQDLSCIQEMDKDGAETEVHQLSQLETHPTDMDQSLKLLMILYYVCQWKFSITLL